MTKPTNLDVKLGAGDGEFSARDIHWAEDAEYRLISGTEYLAYYHEKIRTNQAVKLLFSGDSTTVGSDITDSNFVISTLAKTILNRHMVTTVTSINAGHVGAATQDWINSYLANDMAQNPDLMVLRWGINDAWNPVSTRLATFKTNLRAGLATIRAAKNVQQMSIILMTPNTVYNTYNQSDQAWHDAIYHIIQQAAVDYQCCFVDTQHYLQDSQNVLWQSDAGGAYAGAHIHPLNVGNAWIGSLLAEVLVPMAIRKHGVTNISVLSKTSTDAPSTYEYGLSILRATVGFPYPYGIITTFYHVDGTLIQINSSYLAQAREGIAIRRGLATSGVIGGIGDNAWGAWMYLNAYQAWQDLTLPGDWVAFGGTTFAAPQYAIDQGGNVNIQGIVKSGTVTPGTIIARLPAGYRPARDKHFTVINSDAWGSVKVKANGDVVCGVIANNFWICFGNITFKAEQ